MNRQSADLVAGARVLSEEMSPRISEFRTTHRLEQVLGADASVVRGFARAAADHLATGPLSLDARDRLLKRGERLGLGRFDANLVLAVVERRHRAERPVGRPVRRPAFMKTAASLPSPASSSAGSSSVARRRFTWPAAAVAVLLQAGIVAGAWWLVA